MASKKLAHRVCIVGGGITGLSTAWFLKKRLGSLVDITILEKSNRVGGWIKTLKAGQDSAFQFECGPRGVRPGGEGGRSMLSLIKDLGLESSVVGADPAAKRRFLYYHGQLKMIPGSLSSAAKSPFTLMMLGALFRDLTAGRANWTAKALEEDLHDYKDESIAEFMERRFGRKITETFGDALVSGIYGGDIRQLSVRACFPSLWELEEKYGSVIRGAMKGGLTAGKDSYALDDDWSERMQEHALISFRDGMDTLTDELEKQLVADGVKIHKNCRIRRVQFSHHPSRTEVVHYTKSGGVEAEVRPSRYGQSLHHQYNYLEDSAVDNGDEQRTVCDVFVSTISAQGLASLVDVMDVNFVRGHSSVHYRHRPRVGSLWHADSQYIRLMDELCQLDNLWKEDLRKVLLDHMSHNTSMAVVSLGYHEDDVLPKHLKGFGYLVPQSQRQPILGCVFDSCTFPMQGQGLRSSGRYTPTRITFMIGGEHHLERVYAHDTQLKRTARDALRMHMGVDRHPDEMIVLKQWDCIPQYRIGHLSRMEKVEDLCDKLSNGSMWVHGASFTGVAVNDCILSSRKVAKEVSLFLSGSKPEPPVQPPREIDTGDSTM